MKTPCQKLGYKVGDKFEVICEESEACGFKKGATITLYADDRSDCPLFAGDNTEFSLAGRAAGAYLHLHKVKPLKPKKAAEPAQSEPVQEEQAEPTVQREANGRPVGAKEGGWFRVIKPGEGRPYRIGDIVQFCTDDKSECPFFLLNGLRTCIHWVKLEPCPATTQPEPEPAKPEWEILWGSETDFEGAPDWAVYVLGVNNSYWVEDVTPGAKLMRFDAGLREMDTVKWLAHTTPRSARRLKQPK